MEYTQTQEDKTNKKINNTDNEVIKHIYETFDRLNTERQPQLDSIQRLQDYIFPEKRDKEYKAHDMFEIVQTFKAAIWENLYSNVESLFDVSGEDQDSEDNAPIQKANLVHQFEKAKIQNTIDECIDNLITKSEFICFVGWKKTEKQIKRKREVIEPLFDIFGSPKINPETGMQEQGFNGNYEIATETIENYRGVDFKAVDPCRFVYNTDNKSFKIVQDFKSVQELRENKLLNLLTSSQLDELDELAKDKKESKDKEDKNGWKGDQVEVLEFWGDLKLKDDFKKNYVVVIVARKYIARFEPNPYLIDPYVICHLIKDPKTKRGYLYLLSATENIQTSEDLINDIKSAVDMIVNPPYLSPQGALQGKIELSPGKIIDYNPEMLPKQPERIEFGQALNAFQFVEFLKAQTESNTGVFKNMAGLQEDGDPTATEIKARVGGQNSRLSMIIDTINQNAIIPMVEKAAELEANYNFDTKNIAYNNEFGKQFIPITPDIRQGNYRYIYGDRNDMQLKKLQQEKQDLFIEKAMNHPAMQQQFNVIEYVKYRLEQDGVENVEKFFNAQPPQQIGINPAQQPTPEQGMDNLQGLPQEPNLPPNIQPTM